jgi:hypothetical protein
MDHFKSMVRRVGSRMRAVILEENGDDHGLLRALGHAAYSNMMHRHGDWAVVHGYANALEAWQGMNSEQAFAQGQVFTLPNMTWGQPTYWVLRMVEESYQPRLLRLDPKWTAQAGDTLDVVALRGDSTVVLRAVNFGNMDAALQLAFEHVPRPPSNATVTVLQGQDGDPLEENTPWDTHRVAATVRDQLYDVATRTLQVPHMSFVVLTCRWEWAPGELSITTAVASGRTVLQ